MHFAIIKWKVSAMKTSVTKHVTSVAWIVTFVKGNDCECLSGKSLEVACDAICNVTKLKGEYEDNQCICKAELELCGLDECIELSRENAPPECIFLEPFLCMEYGPLFTEYDCICYTWYIKAIYFAPAKAKKSTGFHRSYNRLISRFFRINYW